MSDLDDLEDFSDVTRYGASPQRESAKLMRSARKARANIKTNVTRPKWQRQLMVHKGHTSNTKPVSVSRDSSLIDDAMRKRIAAASDGEDL